MIGYLGDGQVTQHLWRERTGAFWSTLFFRLILVGGEVAGKQGARYCQAMIGGYRRGRVDWQSGGQRQDEKETGVSNKERKWVKCKGGSGRGVVSLVCDTLSTEKTQERKLTRTTLKWRCLDTTKAN